MKQRIDNFKERCKNISLKKMYYLLFMVFIVVPILSVLIISLNILNKRFKEQAIENIRQSQEIVITDLISDIETMSMRLSNLIYVNEGEILGYAASTNTEDADVRYENMQKLERAEKLSFEPVKDIISIYFYMKDGTSTYLKSYINRPYEDICQESWYQAALSNSNHIVVGYFDTNNAGNLFFGSSNDSLILSFSMAPDVMVDRSEKIEMVTLYQASSAATRIKNNNQAYAAGKNTFGYSQIVDEDGKLIYSSVKEKNWEGNLGYTCIVSPVSVHDEVWYIENYVLTQELTSQFWNIAIIIFFVAVAVFSFVIYFSRFFLKSIINPIEEVNRGLKEVEEGNLDIHISPTGQNEVRNMIHQFNAMTRQQRALLQEYKNRVRMAGKAPADYLKDLLTGEIRPEMVAAESSDFFHEPYYLIGMMIDYYGVNGNEIELSDKIVKSFERNNRFASCCHLVKKSSRHFIVYCRISDEMYFAKTKRMMEELFRMTYAEFGVVLYSCVSRKMNRAAEFYVALAEVLNKLKLRHLGGKNMVLMSEEETENFPIGISKWILEHYTEFEKLSEALFVADEKNITQEKEKLFELLNCEDTESGKRSILAMIVAVGERFSCDLSSFTDIFGKHYNYQDKIIQMSDNKELKIWLTDYIARIINYSASKIERMENDVIIKAKRYIADNFDNPELCLKDVADFVELNEKYFTNKFTKEAGETFSDYLTGIRMQKAKELLRTTNFKVYEIADMVGYSNVTHFNRMFKKIMNMSPMQYRKS